jgi:hypothetical protein
VKTLIFFCLGLILSILLILPIALAGKEERPIVTIVMVSVMAFIPPFLAFLFPFKLPTAPVPSPPEDVHGANFVIKGTSKTSVSLEATKQATLSQLGEGHSRSASIFPDLLLAATSPSHALMRSGIIYDCIFFWGWMRTLVVSIVLIISPLLTVIGVLSVYITATCALFGYMLLIGVIATRKLR